MAEIRPFRAFRYDPQRVELKDVITQPYDKITPEMQDLYYRANPANLIAIEKGRSFETDTATNNVYTRAATAIERWIADKTLIRDQSPSIYVYSQEYLVPDTQSRRERTGFIALGRLEDYDQKVVFRHERTLSAPKVDRIELLRHTRAQTGQLFMLYEDPANRVEALLREVARKDSTFALQDEYGVLHRLWPVIDRNLIGRVQYDMVDKNLVIADGHHRYETALNYRNEQRTRSGSENPDAPWEFAMMTFINSQAKGLTVLPTHRVVRNLKDFSFDLFRKRLSALFDWYSYPFQDVDERLLSLEEFRKDLVGRGRERRAIGIYAGAAGKAGSFYLFLLKRDVELDALLPDVSQTQRQLDVVLLHRLILEKGLGITAEALAAEKNILYERDINNAIAIVDRGDADLACFLNPVHVEQVMQIALDGDVLPQKSTDFYPKMLSGIAIYRLDEGISNKAQVVSQPRAR